MTKAPLWPNTGWSRPPVEGCGTAMMFQSHALFPHLSVIDNVAFSLKMKRVDGGRAAQKGGRVAGTG